MTRSPGRPVLRYYGGKWNLAEWVMTFFPPHEQYVEPFGGAASVLLRKDPVKIEVYNDLDNDIVNLFRVLRAPEDSAELYRLLSLTPYARAEFLSGYEGTDSTVERARRTIVRSLMGHGSSGASGRKTGFRRPCGNLFSPAADWANWREEIESFTARMSRVIIESMDAADLLPHYDSPRTLFYVDPPYPVSTRGGMSAVVDAVYRHDMRTDVEHRMLAERLHTIEGMVVLSGYPCELYDLDLYADWQRHERKHRADAQLERTEVVWLNPACVAARGLAIHQHTLFEKEIA